MIAAFLVAVLAALYAYNVHRRYSVLDDSYISYRYARNLVRGEGLVWNPGERVEGYTNFLWVLLTAAGMKAGISPEALTCGLGTLSGAAVLAALLLLGRRRFGGRTLLAYLAPFVLAVSPSFTSWATSGLETMFFAALTFCGLLLFLSERERGSPRPLGSALLLTLAGLTRPDGALFAAVVGIVFLADLARGRRRWSAFWWWTAPYLVLVVHLLWRRAYYGFWLPNTFYAKVNGAWWDQSLTYFGLFAETYRVVWFLPLLAFAAVRRPRFPNLFLAAAVVVYLAYVAYVGGDHFEFRFLVVVLPCFYYLLADGVRAVGELWPRSGLAVEVAAAVALLAATATASFQPETSDGVANVRMIQSYTGSRLEQGRFLRQLIDDGLLDDDVVLGVSGAGAIPYLTDLPTVDWHGINDVRIAHQPLDKRGVAGHEHVAAYEYLVERKVVIFDALNHIVYDQDVEVEVPSQRGLDGEVQSSVKIRVRGKPLVFATMVSEDELRHTVRVLPLRRVRARGKLLIFATMVPEEELRHAFRHLEILE